MFGLLICSSGFFLANIDFSMGYLLKILLIAEPTLENTLDRGRLCCPLFRGADCLGAFDLLGAGVLLCGALLWGALDICGARDI